MINRAAVIIKGTETLVDWVNEIDTEADITLEEVREESTVYLISDEDAEEFDEWVEDNYLMVFESELQGWYTDNDLWPTDLTIDMFYEWFTISLHSVVEDTVDSEIINEEFEEED